MSVWGTIGSGLGKIGTGLAQGAKTLGQGVQKVGGTIKTGAQKTGQVLKTGKDRLEDMLKSDPTRQTPPDIEKDPLETEEMKKRNKFANALAGFQDYRPAPQYGYETTPIMVDYSEYMGLSPEVQRYLYRGM